MSEHDPERITTSEFIPDTLVEARLRSLQLECGLRIEAVSVDQDGICIVVSKPKKKRRIDKPILLYGYNTGKG